MSSRKKKEPKPKKAVVLEKDSDVVVSFTQWKNGQSHSFISQKDQRGNQELISNGQRVATLFMVNDEIYAMLNIDFHDLDVLQSIQSSVSYGHLLKTGFQPIMHLEDEWKKQHP